MNTLSVKRTAVIETIGSKQASNFWLACHGYGELSRFFIKKFEILADNHFIVAPEALSKFYLKGFTGRVGATWMTSENRDLAIADNNAYLQQVIDTYYQEGNKFIAFGFSQGTESLCRFLTKHKVIPDKLILWGNGLPKDLNSQETSHLKNTDIIFVYGNKDVFLTPARLQEKKDLFEQYGLSYTEKIYDGEHKIYPDILFEITKQY